MVNPKMNNRVLWECECCSCSYTSKDLAVKCCSGVGYHSQYAIWDNHISLYEYNMPNEDCGHGER